MPISGYRRCCYVMITDWLLLIDYWFSGGWWVCGNWDGISIKLSELNSRKKKEKKIHFGLCLNWLAKKKRKKKEENNKKRKCNLNGIGKWWWMPWKSKKHVRVAGDECAGHVTRQPIRSSNAITWFIFHAISRDDRVDLLGHGVGALGFAGAARTGGWIESYLLGIGASFNSIWKLVKYGGADVSRRKCCKWEWDGRCQVNNGIQSRDNSRLVIQWFEYCELFSSGGCVGGAIPMQRQSRFHSSNLPWWYSNGRRCRFKSSIFRREREYTKKKKWNDDGNCCCCPNVIWWPT